MNIWVMLFLIGIIAGFVTGGLKINFDRFFVIILLILMGGMNAHQSVDIYLYIITLGSAFLLAKNFNNLKALPMSNRMKFLLVIPLFALVGVLGGSWLFLLVPSEVLKVTIAIVALLYGVRLALIHFDKTDMEQKEPVKWIEGLCQKLGPILSGFTVGLFGSSLKPLKVPFAVRVGKMNLQKVYIGNAVTAFWAGVIALILHNSVFSFSQGFDVKNLLYGLYLFVIVQGTFMLSARYFKGSWQKPFQIFIGVLLLFVSVRLYLA